MTHLKNEIFNDVADTYRDIHNQNIQISGESSEYFAEYKIIEIKQFFKTNSQLRILDLGCGDGISGQFFLKHFNSIKYSGIDISAESIKVAKTKNLKNCDFIQFNGNQIPFSDSEFDVIFISCVLHHIDQVKHASLLQECYRALKPNGKLIIFEHNPKNPLTRKIVNNCIFDKDAVLISHSYLQQIVTQIGFSTCNVCFTIFMPRKSIFKYLLWIEKILKKIPLGGQYYAIFNKNQ